MLIRFAVENFLSFKDEIEFTLLPGNTEEHKEHLYVEKENSELQILRTSVILGANAAGKTNLIKALEFVQNLVTAGTQVGESIPVTPFYLDLETPDKESRFSFEIKSGPSVYQYEFALDRNRIYSESLYRDQKMLFERVTGNDDVVEVNFTNDRPLFDNEEQANHLVFAGYSTRPNKLFLTESIERNINLFKEPYDWFRTKLVLNFPLRINDFANFVRFLNNESGFREKFRDLVRLYDLDIYDVELKPLQGDPERFLPETQKAHVGYLMSQLDEDFETSTFYNSFLHIFMSVDKYSRFKAHYPETVHIVEREEELRVNFDIEMESEGTKRLLELTPILIRLLNSREEIIFVIDEIDRSLHAEMVRNVFDIFLTNIGNKPAQLIGTTHQVDILDLNLLRSDEIWLIQKNANKSSSLYSLDDFAPKSNADIKRHYLNGLYGGIPDVSGMNQLNWDT